MNLHGWQRDAENLVSNLRSNTLVAKRAEELLGVLFRNGVVVGVDVFDRSGSLSLPPQAFLVTDRTDLKRSTSELGRMARRLTGLAFVAHGEGVPSVLALPPHDPAKPHGNGSIILHELEHITEKKDGIVAASIGFREQRAYSTNAEVFTELDGSDFQTYIDSWPVDFLLSSFTAEIKFHDDDCPEPPKETYLHEMWQEGGASRTGLQSLGRAMVAQELVTNVNDTMAEALLNGIHSS